MELPELPRGEERKKNKEQPRNPWQGGYKASRVEKIEI